MSSKHSILITCAICLGVMWTTQASAQFKFNTDVNLGLSTNKWDSFKSSSSNSTIVDSGDPSLGINIGTSYDYNDYLSLGIQGGYTYFQRDSPNAQLTQSSITALTMPVDIHPAPSIPVFIQAGLKGGMVSFENTSSSDLRTSTTMYKPMWGGVLGLGYSGDVLRTGIRASTLYAETRSPVLTELFIGIAID